MEITKDGMYKPVKVFSDFKENKIYLGTDYMWVNTEHQYSHDVCLAILYPVTNDFKLDGHGVNKNVYGETDSFQVRPKVLYKNKLGIYFNLKGEGRVYLGQDYIDWVIKEYPQYERYLQIK